MSSVDSGAFYDGRTWVHRGNVISNNLFEDIRHSDPQRDNAGGMAAAVYFDDMLSGNRPSSRFRPPGTVVGAQEIHDTSKSLLNTICLCCIYPPNLVDYK